MTRDTKVNLIVAAVAISAVAHVSTMFWAKPRIMARVTSGITRLAHRAPMRVSKAAERPEPVAIAVLRDEPPPKDAPKNQETVALLPAEHVAIPDTPPAQMTGAPAEMPKILSALTPEITKPRFKPSSRAESAPPAPAQKMTFEQPKDISLTAPAACISMQDGSAAPSFEAPVFAPIGKIRERYREPVTQITPPPKPPKKAFKPIEEVMPEVNEKIVQAEKEAVRNLMDTNKSVDLHTAADVTLTTCSEGSWTYFKATVRAKPRLPSIPKDVVILIDASGSIGHDRLSSCKKAAKEILRTAMNTSDRFNLVAFRDKFSYAFRTWQPCDAASYAAGDKWMARLAAHGRTDVFSTISSVLTLPRDPTRPLVALVVTDGEANTGVSATADILARFTKLNDGLISVYMYGVKSSANRELIDVLTHGNRGESFIFDGWRWHAGEGIGAFSERFRDPVVTDLRVFFPHACRAEAYPRTLKNLYRDNSVEIIGRVPNRTGEILFSLRGLSGSITYDGLFRLPLRATRTESSLPSDWRTERDWNAKLCDS